MHSKYSRKTGEVDTVVTKPLTNPCAGQVYFECRFDTCSFLTVVLLLTLIFVDFAFSNLWSECFFKLVVHGEFYGRYVCHDIFMLTSRDRFCAREFDAMHQFGMCGKQGTYAVLQTGAREKGRQPRRKMCTAGPAYPVVKERTRAGSLVFPDAISPSHVRDNR